MGAGAAKENVGFEKTMNYPSGHRAGAGARKDAVKLEPLPEEPQSSSPLLLLQDAPQEINRPGAIARFPGRPMI
jgi:hypothetical protein